MMHDKAWRAFCATSASLILVACAGSDTPATNAELRAEIADRDWSEAVASAGGSSSRAGAGGRAGEGGSAQASAGAAGAGGSGSSAGGSGGSGSGECDGFAVLSANCSGSSCHGEGSQYSNFAESEDVALSFVGESGSASCSTAGPLIDPDNPVASIIIQKVTASSPPCGQRMPIVGGPLSQDDVSCLQEWIGTL